MKPVTVLIMGEPQLEQASNQAQGVKIAFFLSVKISAISGLILDSMVRLFQTSDFSCIL
ncbi:MAG: hypothetical protein QNK37_35845 [Acidobacteriota bacterium]|nr:hypothetical protein [Acidobacteriota bacterium]